MKYILKDVFWNIKEGFKRPQTLEQIKEKIMGRTYKELLNGNIDFHTRSEIYYAFIRSEDIEEINKTLEYEIWYKLFKS